jgi:hypothetical protein
MNLVAGSAAPAALLGVPGLCSTAQEVNAAAGRSFGAMEISCVAPGPAASGPVDRAAGRYATSLAQLEAIGVTDPALQAEILRTSLAHSSPPHPHRAMHGADMPVPTPAPSAGAGAGRADGYKSVRLAASDWVLVADHSPGGSVAATAPADLLAVRTASANTEGTAVAVAAAAEVPRMPAVMRNTATSSFRKLLPAGGPPVADVAIMAESAAVVGEPTSGRWVGRVLRGLERRLPCLRPAVEDDRDGQRCAEPDYRPRVNQTQGREILPLGGGDDVAAQDATAVARLMRLPDELPGDWALTMSAQVALVHALAQTHRRTRTKGTGKQHGRLRHSPPHPQGGGG